MILLREIREQDLEALESFSQIPGFINLPNDRDLLMEKIQRAKNSFGQAAPLIQDSKYLFVAEDLENKKILGTSMIAGQHGTVESPHFYFEVGSEERYSSTISTGFIHGTLKLKYETDGPSEIGGLVLDPELRNSEARIGRQISFVRFLFLGLNRERFKKKILAELLPPLNKRGQSPLWEAIGRRFTNMDYWEADQLSQKSKDFILSLFPSGKIYTAFLSAEARNSIGKVGKETEPVVHMLNKIGFTYRGHVDPFDGGPHLLSKVEDVLPVKKIQKLKLNCQETASLYSPSQFGLICNLEQAPGEFRSVMVQAAIHEDRIQLTEPNQAMVCSVLGLGSDTQVAFMPFY